MQDRTLLQADQPVQVEEKEIIYRQHQLRPNSHPRNLPGLYIRSIKRVARFLTDDDLASLIVERVDGDLQVELSFGRTCNKAVGQRDHVSGWIGVIGESR